MTGGGWRVDGESALGWIVVVGRSGSSLCPVFTLEPCQLP